MHARRIRPAAGPLDRRRLAAAGLSALLPGLGQLVNRRRRLTAVFLVPSLIVLIAALVLAPSQSPAGIAAWVISPRVLGVLLTLNGLILVWRLVSVGQAFLDTRLAGPTSRVGIIGIALLAIAVALPHGVLQWYGTSLSVLFGQVFTDTRDAEPLPDRRINVLLVGTDKTRLRTTTLTDTMIVASLDPVGNTVSLLSIPRDLVRVPLGNGDTFGPKINSLLMYADSHEQEFPAGGMATLQRAIGALLGIEIPYYAEMRFGGLIDMVDAVGGVDVDVAAGFEDPDYDGYGMGGRGFAIEAGRHHLDGVHALAYARARKADGESDFTRASRQQQILLALRHAATRDGSLVWRLPELMEAAGETVRTNVPTALIPRLAALVDDLDDDTVTRSIIRHPLVRSRNTEYGSSLVPDLEAIREVAAKLFPAPGTTPIPWPTPEPSPTPAADAGG